MGPINKLNKGFSLVELMIAMTVSLLILAGLFYSVMGDMRSYESVRSSQKLIDKGRTTVQMLRLYIQQAGFRDIAALKNETTFNTGASVRGNDWEYGQVVQGVSSENITVNTTLSDITNSKADSHILILRFLGASEAGIVSCTGENLDETTSNEISLYVNTSDQLICQDNNNFDDDSDSDTTNDVVVLTEGVEFLELLYGTEDDFRYFTDSEVSDWADINRVKIGLLLSAEVNAHGLINSNEYTIFNETIAAANDTKYRSIVMETVIIGNQGG